MQKYNVATERVPYTAFPSASKIFMTQPVLGRPLLLSSSGIESLVATRPPWHG
jgi:hypothetical protein